MSTYTAIFYDLETGTGTVKHFKAAGNGGGMSCARNYARLSGAVLVAVFDEHAAIFQVGR